jgi:hypothetical protein
MSQIPKQSFLRLGSYLSSFFNLNQNLNQNFYNYENDTFLPLIDSSISENCDKLILANDSVKNELLILVNDVQKQVNRSIESDQYVDKSVIKKTQKQLVNRMFAYNKTRTKINKWIAKHST